MYRKGFYILLFTKYLSLSDTSLLEHHTHRATHCSKCIKVPVDMSNRNMIHFNLKFYKSSSF